MPRNRAGSRQDASTAVLDTSAAAIPVEVVAITSLKAHPRNYRSHPPDQLAHIIRSIEEHGIYRNVVIARDSTILAGHGVVKALTEMGRSEVPVLRLPIDPDSPAALKVLAGDNEIGHLAEIDDRLFTEILKEIKDLGELMGTGYDDMMLANLLYVTTGETVDRDEADAWAESGMHEYGAGVVPFRLVVSFRNEADRAQFVEQTGMRVNQKQSATWMTWWPYREKDDLQSLRFEKAAP